MTDFVLFKKPVASPIFFRSDSTLQYLRYRILLRKRLKGKHLKVIQKILNYKEYKSHFTQSVLMRFTAWNLVKHFILWYNFKIKSTFNRKVLERLEFTTSMIVQLHPICKIETLLFQVL